MGTCFFDTLECGIYTVFVNDKDYARKIYENIKVKENKIKLLNHIILDKKLTKESNDSAQSRPILIKPDEPTQQYYNTKQIMRMPY